MASSSRPSLDHASSAESASRTLMAPPTPGGGVTVTTALSTEPPSTIATMTTSPSPGVPYAPHAPHSPEITPVSGSTAVKWADQLGSATSKAAHAASKTSTGATKMVGWTYEHAKLETATHARGLRPMHVRVSVRVHHVAFLHPGLDNGGRATIGGRAGKWRFARRDRRASPPGLLQFGKKKGDWKNPTFARSKFHRSSSRDEGGGADGRFPEDAADASEIAEIISAEAFRLSRDGIIQNHYALNSAAKNRAPPSSAPSGDESSQTSPTYRGSSHGRLGGGLSPFTRDVHSSMLSPYSSANPQEAARYYRECAARPKGYRRLVVSSATPAGDAVAPPPPPAPARHASSRSISTRGGGGFEGAGRGGKGSARSSSASTWYFESDGVDDAEESGGRREEEKNENLFNNVEYQYIGPPQTGPEFFQLLRAHGAATFGRYLPELACSVPDHSIGFELKRPKSRRRCASTQPLVVEAPHLVWGDARDKMLSKIAKEGCPLIDSRKFEYVTNAALDETELSESLMVCGATLWVQNAPEDDEVLSPSKLKPHYTKGMVKAEYYGGKIVDGIAEGLGVGAKGLVRGTKKTARAAEKVTKKTVHGLEKGVKGTREVAHAVKEGTKELVHSPHHRDLGSSTSLTEATSQAPNETKQSKRRKRDRLKSTFNPKKVGNKLRRRSKDDRDGGGSVDGSRHSAPGDDDESEEDDDESVEDDDYSVGGESAATDLAHVSGAAKPVVNKDFATHVGDDALMKEPTETANKEARRNESDDFTVVKPVPYVLLLDDVIEIRIVSFPDKNDVIAHFPVSVASVMSQRSIEDRTSDPLRPSELTATLIQEPNAQELRWGVELKVTLRAVEVKPNIPKVVPRPKDVIDEEMNKIKERLKLLQKTPEEVKKDLQAKEEEIMKEENDLNAAIVAYGHGKGENEGAGQSEVRLRQMFYCEREHGAISRKMKRRATLTEIEKHMIQDALIDPSSLEKDYDAEEKKKLSGLIDLNFPGIEKEDDTVNEPASLDAGSPSIASPGKGSATIISPDAAASASLSSGSAASINNDFGMVNGALAKASLDMAQSLDICLGGLMDKPTVAAVQRRLCHTFTEGMVTKSAAKKWCSQVAEKVSSVSASDAPIKSSIAKIQSIIAESALGSGMDLEESIIDHEEETKLNEDEIELSEAKKSESEDFDSNKLLEWINAVSSQLEAYAEELDDDQESLAYSEALSSMASMDEEKTASSIGGLVEHVSLGTSSPRLEGGIAVSGITMDEQLQQASSIESPRKSDPDGAIWERVLSRKESGMSSRRLSSSSASLRIRNATSVSTVRNALPRSQTKQINSQTEPLLKMMKESHGHTHHTNMRTTSLSGTLFYLSLMATVFVIGAAAALKFYEEMWSLVMGMG